METMFEIVARCLFGSVEGVQALAAIEAAYEDLLHTVDELCITEVYEQKGLVA